MLSDFSSADDLLRAEVADLEVFVEMFGLVCSETIGSTPAAESVRCSSFVDFRFGIKGCDGDECCIDVGGVFSFKKSERSWTDSSLTADDVADPFFDSLLLLVDGSSFTMFFMYAWEFSSIPQSTSLSRLTKNTVSLSPSPRIDSLFFST